MAVVHRLPPIPLDRKPECKITTSFERAVSNLKQQHKPGMATKQNVWMSWYLLQTILDKRKEFEETHQGPPWLVGTIVTCNDHQPGFDVFCWALEPRIKSFYLTYLDKSGMSYAAPVSHEWWVETYPDVPLKKAVQVELNIYSYEPHDMEQCLKVIKDTITHIPVQVKADLKKRFTGEQDIRGYFIPRKI